MLSLQVLFNCGPSGDKLLQSQRYSLPAFHVLHRSLEGIPTDTGLLNTVFELLQLKVAQMRDKERDCRMSTTTSAQYDQPDSFTSSHWKSNMVLQWY